MIMRLISISSIEFHFEVFRNQNKNYISRILIIYSKLYNTARKGDEDFLCKNIKIFFKMNFESLLQDKNIKISNTKLKLNISIRVISTGLLQNTGLLEINSPA